MRGALTLLLALSALAGPGCRDPGQGGSPPNVLLVTIDTLRADRLSAWGYGKPTSPAIDRLAAESVVFLDAQATSSWTLPSLASLLTSQHASTLDIWDATGRLDSSFETLAERLGAVGYRSFGIGSHVYLGERFGLTQGFDDYDSELVREQLASHLAISSPSVTERGIAWLASHGQTAQPWLLWAHYFDPHAIYHAHPGMEEAFGATTDSERYDGEIAFTDAAIGRLLEAVAEAELDERTIVVLTSDHGEELGERGATGHGVHVHRETVHVPLIFRVPGAVPRRVGARVSLVDVLPTLLELLGLPPDPDLAGRSLVPALRGEPLPDAPVFAEVRLRQAQDSMSIGRWKLVRDLRAKRLRLYDLASDPAERRDVFAAHPEVGRRLGLQLGTAVREARARGRRLEQAPRPPLDDAELERLRELGYLE